MKFDLETTGLIIIPKYAHRITLETIIYRNTELSIFGIAYLAFVNTDTPWAIIHIPSERVIVSKFYSKDEAEEYWDILAEEIDLDSIILCNPNFENITEQLKYDVEIAYKKYLSHKDLRL